MKTSTEVPPLRSAAGSSEVQVKGGSNTQKERNWNVLELGFHIIVKHR